MNALSAASQDILGNSLWIASRPEGGERRAGRGERFLLRSPRSALRSPTERENAMFDENTIALVKLH